MPGLIQTYNGVEVDGVSATQGGYSDHIVVKEGYVLSIPDNLPLDASAPLLCAGITLYSPLKHWNAGPGKKVAILGLGGLGHMGVKLAHALGAHVTVLSQSLKKADDGKRLGADVSVSCKSRVMMVPSLNAATHHGGRAIRTAARARSAPWTKVRMRPRTRRCSPSSPFA